jgi:hypothetical protein
MNPPNSTSEEGASIGPAARASRIVAALAVPILACAVPIVVFAVDYIYFGPIILFGPFIAWALAALGMAGLFASYSRDMPPFAAGVTSSFLAGGGVLSTGLFLVYLVVLAVAPSSATFGIEVVLFGATTAYWRRWHTFAAGHPRGASWTRGVWVGLVVCLALPILVQTLHAQYFESRLADLASPDANVRSGRLRSLAGSRFCWSACTRVVCAARGDLDPDTVKAVLATNDVDLMCDNPGMSEWGG